MLLHNAFSFQSVSIDQELDLGIVSKVDHHSDNTENENDTAQTDISSECFEDEGSRTVYIIANIIYII